MAEQLGLFTIIIGIALLLTGVGLIIIAMGILNRADVAPAAPAASA
jgi:multisubunit Na+/H+ antiporter MnhC subunit